MSRVFDHDGAGKAASAATGLCFATQTKVQFAAVVSERHYLRGLVPIKSAEIALTEPIRRIVAVNKSSITSGLGFGPRIVALAFVFLALGVSRATTQQAAVAISEADAKAIGADAYIYGYPLITMEYSRRVLTNVAEPAATKAPMGDLARARSYPNASFRDVTAPNADTLYTQGWIDLGKEPYVLSLPDAHA